MLSQLKQWRQKTKTNTVCPFNWNHRQLLRHRKFWPHFSCLLAVLCSYLVIVPMYQRLNRFISHISKTHELTVFTNHCRKLFMFCVKKKKKVSFAETKTSFPITPRALLSFFSTALVTHGLTGYRVFSPLLSLSHRFREILHRRVGVWQHFSARRTEQCWYEICLKVMKICST